MEWWWRHKHLRTSFSSMPKRAAVLLFRGSSSRGSTTTFLSISTVDVSPKHVLFSWLDLDSKRRAVLTCLSVFIGKSKTSLGWTSLHLACYFGHKDVVEELLRVRAGIALDYSVYGTHLQAVRWLNGMTFAGWRWCEFAGQHGWYTSAQSSLHWEKGKTEQVYIKTADVC